MVIWHALITTSTYALRHNYDPALLDDMYTNPANYIMFGGIGSGVQILLDKSSVNVHKYSPPNYIIAANTISISTQVFDKSKGYEQRVEKMSNIDRFFYDFSQRKMYHERFKEDGTSYWEYLDPKWEREGGNASGYPQAINLGELAFYIAYNMSFYEKPVGYYADEYINNGRISSPLLNLPSYGAKYPIRYYNYRTKQYEVYEEVYDKSKNKSFLKRLK